MKRFFVTIIFSLLYLGSQAMACDYFPIFFVQNNELDLPCVDVGEPYCIRAKLNLITEQGETMFELSYLSGTRDPVPKGEKGFYIPSYDFQNSTLHLPYVAVDMNLSTYELFLRLDTSQKDRILFKVEGVSQRLMSNNMCTENAKMACLTLHPETDRVLMCIEYNGPPLIVRKLSAGCMGLLMYEGACPTDGAIASCTMSLGYSDDVYTMYLYEDMAAFQETFANGCEAGGGDLQIRH